MSGKKMFAFFSLSIAALVGAVTAVPYFSSSACVSAANACNERATGHGTLTLPDGTKRQFSFNAVGQPDGTAKGNAVIHNKSFDFKGNIEVMCLDVQGNRARIAGIVKNTNDPKLDNQTAVFEVYDKGNPGKGLDTISSVFFTADPAPTAKFCQDFEGFSQMPIEGGNVSVTDCP